MEQKMNNNPMIEAHKKGPVRDEYDHIVGSFFSSSSSSDSEVSSETSLESDSFEEVTSQASSSSSSSPDPLSDMSSLFQQLPLKRGLSKFYPGKSQSFTSLASVMSLEDLVKPENPYNKKLKSCKSYGGGFGESQGSKCTTSSASASASAMSRLVSKRGVQSAGSRGSCSSLSARRSGTNFMGSRPPIPPHRSSTSTTNIPNQTALFA